MGDKLDSVRVFFSACSSEVSSFKCEEDRFRDMFAVGDMGAMMIGSGY